MMFWDKADDDIARTHQIVLHLQNLHALGILEFLENKWRATSREKLERMKTGVRDNKEIQKALEDYKSQNPKNPLQGVEYVGCDWAFTKYGELFVEAIRRPTVHPVT